MIPGDVSERIRSNLPSKKETLEDDEHKDAGIFFSRNEVIIDLQWDYKVFNILLILKGSTAQFDHVVN